jgi:sterol desaturase/sphingolipid hydroxylase (fatty acid hydroxylase superfamily)
MFLCAGILFLFGSGMVLVDPFSNTPYVSKTLSSVTPFASWFYPICNFAIYCLVQSSLLTYCTIADSTVHVEFIKFMVGIAISNVVFYTGHSLLHRRAMYRFHAMHHAYITTTPRAALYMHPLELFIGPILTTALPILLLNPLRPIAYLATGCAIIQAVQSHSSKPGFHQTHHRTQRINLGFENAVFNKLCGTAEVV